MVEELLKCVVQRSTDVGLRSGRDLFHLVRRRVRRAEREQLCEEPVHRGLQRRREQAVDVLEEEVQDDDEGHDAGQRADPVAAGRPAEQVGADADGRQQRAPTGATWAKAPSSLNQPGRRRRPSRRSARRRCRRRRRAPPPAGSASSGVEVRSSSSADGGRRRRPGDGRGHRVRRATSPGRSSVSARPRSAPAAAAPAAPADASRSRSAKSDRAAGAARVLGVAGRQRQAWRRRVGGGDDLGRRSAPTISLPSCGTRSGPCTVVTTISSPGVELVEVGRTAAP